MFSSSEHREIVVSIYGESMSGTSPARSGCDNRQVLQTGYLPQETGIRRRIALIASICVQGSLMASIFRHEITCVVLFLLGVAGIAWSYRAELKTTGAVRRSSRTLVCVVAPSVVLLCAIGIFLFASRPHYRVLAQGSAPKNSDRIGKKAGGNPEDSYVSVILWPKRPQVTKVVAPPSRLRPTTMVRLSRPLVIPFTGAYWYFRSPAKAPGRSAHIARGSPTKISIHSTDWHPLIMEAHQRLLAPVDPRCCRELDLSILNADDRPGTIRIAVELIDSSSSEVRLEDLGTQPVLSSMPPKFSLNRHAVDEVLKFPLPPNRAIRQFDEIEVVFLPSKERSLGGAQIAIRSFQLLPTW